MNQRIAGLKEFQLRKVLTTLLIGVACFVSLAVGQVSFIAPAQAATTPEASEYQVNQPNQQAQNQSRNLTQSGKAQPEGIKEKLNLNEPLPESTKAFFKQIQGKDVHVDEPKPSGKGETPRNE